MSQSQLSALLVLIVPNIICEIVANENVSESVAMNELYQSKLYSALEEEKTELWHLSPKALYELYAQEKKNGRIDYPEEV